MRIHFQSELKCAGSNDQPWFIWMGSFDRVTVLNWRTLHWRFTGAFWTVCVLALSWAASSNCSKYSEPPSSRYCCSLWPLSKCVTVPMKNSFFFLSGNFFDGKWLSLSSIHTLKKKKTSTLLPLLCWAEFKTPVCCSGLQRRRWRSDVSRSDDRVHQQQAERPETQRDPLPASPSCTDSHPDGEVSAWQGTVGTRWAQDPGSGMYLFS